MTPAQLIAQLDRALTTDGETVVLRRYTAASGAPRPKTDIADVPASVRPVKPADLVGDIDQTASKVVMSPTGIAALLPIRKGDKVLVAGAEKNVEFPAHIRVKDQIVRIELTVTG